MDRKIGKSRKTKEYDETTNYFVDKNYINCISLKEKIAPDSYLCHIPAVRHLIDGKSIAFNHPVTFFVGENGTGKSTLIEAIAVAYGFNAEGGSKNFNFSTNETHSNLHEHIRVAKGKRAKDGFFFRAESFYNIASNIDIMKKNAPGEEQFMLNYGGKSLHQQSHGESFLSLMQNRFWGNGIYICDEPESALSPLRLMTLIIEIDALVRQNSQFIIATHSPMLMAFPDAQIYQLTENGIAEATYQETKHFQLTKLFFESPERMMRNLLDK